MEGFHRQIILGIFCIVSTLLATEHFDIILKQKWRDLDSTSEKTIDFGGKWILVGSIIFKKKSKDYISIESISLRWDGSPIENLIASLYKKIPNKDFLPLEDYLLCDGVWNKKKQTLILPFDEKETLGPITKFYLVLTIPEELESTLKKGLFYLEEQSLPGPFKACARQEKLILAINALPKETSPL